RAAEPRGRSADRRARSLPPRPRQSLTEGFAIAPRPEGAGPARVRGQGVGAMFENSRNAAAPETAPAGPYAAAAGHPSVTVMQLREWIRAAQPNARLVYAHG